MKNSGETVLRIRAYWELLRYDLVNRIFGLGRVYNDLRELPEGSQDWDEHLQAETLRAMDVAIALYWKPVRCLQRSVAMSRLLRKMGVGASLVIGFRSVPFMSHAWVEVGDRVVNDLPAYKDRLLVLDRL